MSETRFPIVHKNGCHEVGAYTTLKNAKAGDRMDAEDFFRLDGIGYEAGEICVCGHCGKIMKYICPEWIDYENPIEVEAHGD